MVTPVEEGGGFEGRVLEGVSWRAWFLGLNEVSMEVSLFVEEGVAVRPFRRM